MCEGEKEGVSASENERINVPPSMTLAGESGGIERLPGRLERYAQMHTRALLMADYIRSISTSKGNLEIRKRLHNCGRYLHFRDYYTVDQLRLIRADFCKQHLICPLCALRRGAKFVDKYMERVELIGQEQGGFMSYLVTLTVKDGPDLEERYNHLHGSYRAMRKKRKDAEEGKRKSIEMNKAFGGVASYEFKRGSGSGMWHPHIHAVWLCKEEPQQESLARDWQEITGDSYIVDITPFHDDPVSGFLEVFRYALKFSDMEIPDNWSAAQVLKSRRLVAAFGCLYGVKVPEKLEDEPIEDLPYVDRLYRYHVRSKAYDFVPLQGDKAIHARVIVDKKRINQELLKDNTFK